MQAEFVRRARLFLTEGVEDIWAHVAQHPDERLPVLVLAVGEPPGVLRGLVEGLAREAPRLGAVVLGVGWEPGNADLVAAGESGVEFGRDLPGIDLLRPLLLGRREGEEAIDVIERAYPRGAGAGTDRSEEPSRRPGPSPQPRCAPHRPLSL